MKKKEEIINEFSSFIKKYDDEQISNINGIWLKHNQVFREFWNDKIMNPKVEELYDSEIDRIVQILDIHAKGNTKGNEAVARVMIPQAVWRRMFNEFKELSELRTIINNIFTETDDEKKINLIDKLYEMNEGRKNSLTGKSANAINALLGAYDALSYIHIVSLNDRKRVIDNFDFPEAPDFENDSIGKQVIESNKCILNGFKTLGINETPRMIAKFLYESPIRSFWRDKQQDPYIEEDEIRTEIGDDLALFYMESHLEDFIIENWDKTELGKDYDLIVENGEIKSQQYKTDIGFIDILVQDKKTKQYVVIELKKNQSSDNTIGQLTRYMGWLEEKKTNGIPTKGIIIAAQYDEKLYYALKKVRDVDVYLYRVDFKLEEFKRN